MPIFDRTEIVEKYVVFADILGFGSRVIDDYDKTLDIYEQVLEAPEVISWLTPEIQVSIYSDSFILVSVDLDRLIDATRMLYMVTLKSGLLVRGGIAKGKHIESLQSSRLHMVSEALVKAVKLEKEIKFPCLGIHPDIEIPDEWWTKHNDNIKRSILYFGGLRIVNPCIIPLWKTPIIKMFNNPQDHQKHQDKYQWFSELLQAISSPVQMIPPKFQNQ